MEAPPDQEPDQEEGDTADRVDPAEAREASDSDTGEISEPDAGEDKDTSGTVEPSDDAAPDEQ